MLHFSMARAWEQHPETRDCILVLRYLAQTCQVGLRVCHPSVIGLNSARLQTWLGTGRKPGCKFQGDYVTRRWWRQDAGLRIRLGTKKVSRTSAGATHLVYKRYGNYPLWRGVFDCHLNVNESHHICYIIIVTFLIFKLQA